MQSFYTILRQFNHNLMKGIPYRIQTLTSQIAMPKSGFSPQFSTLSEDPKLKELLDYLENLKNYEKSGVPKDAGTDSEDGFDLGRMKRLMERLGNPHANFHAVHIAGTKGKGSTAAFLSNILREAGYSVGCYTSPHLHTIRERISIGGKGEPIAAEALMDLFHRVKKILDQSIELESGSLSHFEVFTAMAFTLFDKENVDIAVVEAGLGGARDATNVLYGSQVATSVITTIGEEHLAALGGSLESIAVAKSGIIKHGRPLVMGGPFKSHIEYILRHKASLMCSPVVSASDHGIQRVIRGIYGVHDKLYQSCDIIIRVEKDLKLFIELKDLRLQMLGSHQLQNAVTATCAALCLREQGWAVSDESIRAGLEEAYLLGRSQFLTEKEAEVIGLSGGVSLLIDGAHTEASAKSLADTVRMIHPNEPLALVVAMASDKDHVAFARQLLSGMQPQVVLLTEVSIAGGKSRMSSASTLKEAWVQAATELGIGFLDVDMRGHKRLARDHIFSSTGLANYKTLFATAPEMETVKDSILVANELMRSRAEQQSGVIVGTGSLHLVSAVLTCLHR